MSVLTNFWLNYYDLENIGGILGIGFNAEGGGNFWSNNNFEQNTYAVQLTLNATDWSWMSNPPPNKTEQESSFLDFGNLDM